MKLVPSLRILPSKAWQLCLWQLFVQYARLPVFFLVRSVVVEDDAPRHDTISHQVHLFPTGKCVWAMLVETCHQCAVFQLCRLQ